jgi:tRNA(Arg) A34 adenosine deaminase TadA
MNIDKSIIDQLYNIALKSNIEHKLAAVIIKGNKIISKPSNNTSFIMIKNINTGSLHAEVNAIIKYFGKSFYFYKNNVFFPEEYKKKKKIDLVVIRINKNGDLCNARPCYKCLNLMKLVNINKVYYSISSEKIICENVKNMVSIQSSNVTRSLDLFNNDNISLYYEKLLIKYFPSIIQKYNLYIFIEYNLKILLPDYKIKIYNYKKKTFIDIINKNNIKIIESHII